MWSSRNACAVGVRTVCASLTGRHAQASNAHVNRLCSILFQRWTCYGQAGGGRDATPRAARPTRRGGSERDRPVACHDPKGSCRTKRAIPQLPRRVGERLARGASDLELSQLTMDGQPCSQRDSEHPTRLNTARLLDTRQGLSAARLLSGCSTGVTLLACHTFHEGATWRSLWHLLFLIARA